MDASARDVILPAGTILQCTLNEPGFSSSTVEVGDPVLCHLREVSAFGQLAFPRGSYLMGHLESAKDPGHFVGKGNLKLQFDRIGVPGGDVPLDAKIVAVRGYKVDKEGTIHGKGHAKRDIVEWMLPPLWPWKVIMLPARGPRPKLKGETVLNLRLMDDVQIPQITQSYEPEWHSFSRPQSESFRESASKVPASRVPGVHCSQCLSNGPTALTTARASNAAGILQTAAATPPAGIAPGVTLFILKSGGALAVSDYILENGHIAYNLIGGGGGITSFDEVDWNATVSINAERGVGILLRSGQTSLSSQDLEQLQPTEDGNRPLTVIVLKDGAAYVTRDYWVDGWRMHCISDNGEEKLFALDRVDLLKTVHLNRERHVKFILQSGVRSGE